MLKNKLKPNNVKLKMKSAILILCILGTSGSYAMLVSEQQYKPEIKFELGKLDSNLLGSERDIPINIEGIMPGETREDNFIFKNTGTLKQNLQISFDINAKDSEILKYFKCEFKIKDMFSEKNSIIYSGNMFDLKSKSYIDILDENNEKMVIDKGQEMEILATIELADDILKEYSGENFTFNLKILSTQVNKK